MLPFLLSGSVISILQDLAVAAGTAIAEKVIDFLKEDNAPAVTKDLKDETADSIDDLSMQLAKLQSSAKEQTEPLINKLKHDAENLLKAMLDEYSRNFAELKPLTDAELSWYQTDIELLKSNIDQIWNNKFFNRMAISDENFIQLLHMPSGAMRQEIMERYKTKCFNSALLNTEMKVQEQAELLLQRLAAAADECVSSTEKQLEELQQLLQAKKSNQAAALEAQQQLQAQISCGIIKLLQQTLEM